VNTITSAADSTQESTARLKRELKIADAKKRAMALLLIAPLAIFLFLIFVVPIGALLTRAAENPEVATALPHTGVALGQWDRKSPPPDAAYAALAQDLTAIQDGESMGALARRLNTEIPGYRSLVAKTARAMPLTGDDGKPLAAPQIRAKILEIDERWGDVNYWQAIAKNASRYSPFYLLASLDHRQDGFGNIEHAGPDQSIYLNIFARTFVIGVAVTFFALLLGYPLAYWISTLPARKANLVMVLVLIPFWTSVLVRVAAWIVLLQSEGLVNKALIGAGLIDHPFALDDAHPAALHDPAALQRDEVGSSDLPARGRVARQPSVRRVLAGVRAADVSGHRRGRAARVHSRDRLLHHAGAARRAERPDGQLLHRLFHERDDQLGHGLRARRPAARRHARAVRDLRTLHALEREPRIKPS
jgi:ABC-type sugar transport system permease subunit